MDELLNGTVAEAAEKLAAYAVALRKTPRSAQEKSASASDFLSSMGQHLQQNPTLTSSLVGAGLGAGAGGLSTMWGNRGKDPAERKGLMGSMLTGALAGGGIGAGVGMARHGFGNLKGPDSGMGSDALKPGQFVDPSSGQKMQISPDSLKQNPDLHKQVKALTTPSTQSRIAGGVGGLLDTIHKEAPITSTAAAIGAPIDFALHNPLFGLARTTPESAGGYWGRKFLSTGAAGDKTLPDILKNVLSRNERPEPGRIETPGTTGRNKGVLDLLGGRAHKGHGDDVMLRVNEPVTRDIERDAHGIGKWKETEPVLDAHGTPTYRAHELNRGQIASLKGTGSEGIKALEGRQLYKVPGTNKMYHGMPGFGKAMGLRAGVYGLPIATEYLVRGMQEDMQNKQTLRELMAQHAKPVPEGK